MPGTLPNIHDPAKLAVRYVRHYRSYAECRVDGHMVQALWFEAREQRDGMAPGWTRHLRCDRCGAEGIDFFDWRWAALRRRRWSRPPGWNSYGVGRRGVTLCHLRSALHPVDAASAPRATL